MASGYAHAMPRRTNREHRKSGHKNPGRGLSARARAAKDAEIRERREEREPVGRPERRPRALPAPSTLVVVCQTGKLGFTRERAEAKLAEYQSSPRPPSRVYACPHCSTPALEVWHLTSEPARVRAEPRAKVPPAPPRPSWMAS